jgi:2,4-dienoyl-CoA reductase-like NADH-dependent reductase (Old Yellow Enzyme family)
MAYFPAIFSPFTIGSLRLKNRVLMAAMGNNFSHPEGTVSDRAIAYYRERARGGAGLIITEACPAGQRGNPRGLRSSPPALRRKGKEVRQKKIT